MPLAGFSSWPTSCDHTVGCQVDHALAVPPHDAHGASGMEVYSDFLNARPVRTSFKMLKIKFHPKAEPLEPVNTPCEEDRDVCEEQCRNMFGARKEMLEQPCMDAVAAQFGGGMCFPGSATVQERRRGTVCVADVEVGDELAVSSGSFSRVVGLLHDNADVTEVYLQIRYDGPGGEGGCLLVSAQHLVRARLRGRFAAGDSTKEACTDDLSSGWLMKKPVAKYEWTWTAAEDIRPQDDLTDQNGSNFNVMTFSNL